MKLTKTLAAAAVTLLMTTAAWAVDNNAARYAQVLAQFDANRDGVITRSEFPGDPSSFDSVDRNRDGRITTAEAQWFAQNGDWQTEARKLDRNRDGVVSRSEWRGDMNTFRQLDRNGDGVISQADRTSYKTTKRFRGLDRNGDGVISRTEWRGNANSFRQHDRNRDGVISGSELR